MFLKVVSLRVWMAVAYFRNIPGDRVYGLIKRKMGRSSYCVCISYEKRVVGVFLGCHFLSFFLSFFLSSSFFFFFFFWTVMVSVGWNPFLSHVIRT